MLPDKDSAANSVCVYIAQTAERCGQAVCTQTQMLLKTLEKIVNPETPISDKREYLSSLSDYIIICVHNVAHDVLEVFSVCD